MTTLRSGVIELAGNWKGKRRRSVQMVLENSRRACLDDIRLLSDRQPTRLRVEARKSGWPAVWLHPDEGMAWIVVNVGDRDWSKLSYQFGHELGHVFANSWRSDAKPGPPCQWIEEALVEAFSLRGLGRLAASWKTSPPFAGDHAFGDAIERYRAEVIRSYRALSDDQGLSRDAASWFAKHRSEIEIAGLNPYGQAMASLLLTQYEEAPHCMEALGALNRWPERSGIEIAAYLQAWEASCDDLGASPHLPTYLRGLLKAA
jgi:hypothetical protein